MLMSSIRNIKQYSADSAYSTTTAVSSLPLSPSFFLIYRGEQSSWCRRVFFLFTLPIVWSSMLTLWASPGCNFVSRDGRVIRLRTREEQQSRRCKRRKKKEEEEEERGKAFASSSSSSSSSSSLSMDLIGDFCSSICYRCVFVRRRETLLFW